MSVSLPRNKIISFAAVLEASLNRKRASKRQLQKLAGKLAYAAHVVNAGGRTYLQRVLDLMRRLHKPGHKAKLDAGFHADVLW